MKKLEVKNPHRFSLGLVSVIIAVGLLFIRDWILAAIFLLGAVIYFVTSFSEDSVVDRVEKNIENGTFDERDYFIALRAGRQTLTVMNWLLIGGWLLLMLMGSNYPDLFLAGDILLIVFYVLNIVNHLSNLYYEKHC